MCLDTFPFLPKRPKSSVKCEYISKWNRNEKVEYNQQNQNAKCKNIVLGEGCNKNVTKRLKRFLVTLCLVSRKVEPCLGSKRLCPEVELHELLPAKQLG